MILLPFPRDRARALRMHSRQRSSLPQNRSDLFPQRYRALARIMRQPSTTLISAIYSTLRRAAPASSGTAPMRVVERAAKEV